MKWYRYRITTDRYLGFEVQWKHILLPFWVSDWPTFLTADGAEKYCRELPEPKKIVKYLGAL